MLQRVFVIFLTALLEAARSPLAWVGGILLLVVIPVATHLVGGSETETETVSACGSADLSSAKACAGCCQLLPSPPRHI